MTYTTNYSLHKPSTTDNFNISDFNANSDIIDKQFGITSANIPKVTCGTSASTVAKTATINGTFVLNRGARVLVVLSTANTVASATFNLNSTGAKPILVNGASVTTSNLTAQTYLAEFDGTNWRFTTSTYTSDYARTSHSASSATTATSASKLTTARKTYVTLGTASTTITRDWSGDTTIPVSGTLPITNGGTGATTAVGAEYNLIGSVTTVETDLTDSRYFALRNETVSNTNGSFRWNKVSKIKKYTESNYWYGTCSTASATVAKTVTLSGFELVTNVRVTIKFTNANTATNATLNINSTGAKPIYYKGTNVGNNIIDAKSTVNLVYNGTQYEIIGDFTPTTTSTVTGVKGEAEDSYRDGNVNITKSDLGLTTDTLGIEWYDSNITSGSFGAPYYANGIWVIGSSSGVGIKYSTDGKTWSNSNITSGNFNAPYYANGIWVIGSSSGVGIKYSTDGKTWSDSNITSGSYNAPYYANGIWVIGSDYDNGIKYSTDGKTWSSSNITSVAYNTPYHANGIWVIGSYNDENASIGFSNGIHYSIDGKSWKYSNEELNSFNAPYYANGIWVIGGGGRSYSGIKYSTDGKIWSDSNITNNDFSAPYYANGIWVIGCSGGGSNIGIKYSTDGKTWSSSNITSGQYNAPYYANGIWVIGSRDYANDIKYSTDGKTWSSSNITSGKYNAPYYANGIWVIGSSSGVGIKYSTFNSLNDLASAFKGISELKSYINDKSYITNHTLYL